ncbi:hypothetical protein HMPREF1640_08620 [Prevotella sp. S7-1-8]|nr:hypothetical protein HMPREF1640_08620 [Prevotella sp. S7-1-8]
MPLGINGPPLCYFILRKRFFKFDIYFFSRSFIPTPKISGNDIFYYIPRCHVASVQHWPLLRGFPAPPPLPKNIMLALNEKASGGLFAAASSLAETIADFVRLSPARVTDARVAAGRGEA